MPGTGLPIPKSQNVVAQPAPFVNADAYSSAQAWTTIAAAGAKLENTAENVMAKEVHLQQAGYIARTENAIKDWYVKANDQHHGDPDGFERAARAYMDGVISEAPGWAAAHVQKYSGSLTEAGIGHQLSVKRGKDETIARDQIVYRLKSADETLMSLSSAPQFDPQTADAAIKTYNGILDTAVQTGIMAPAHAEFLRDDAALRSQGNRVRVGLEDVYRREGYESAKDWLKGTVTELGAKYKFSDKIVRDGMSWLRSEEAGFRGERDAIGREWTAARGQIETVPKETLADMRDRAYAVGNLKVGQEIEANAAALEIARGLRTLPPAELAAVAGSGKLAVAPFDASLAKSESSGSPNLVNQLGYAGLYQFGAPRMASLGIYKPGEGEDLKGWSRTPGTAPGKWSGTFNIPGFENVKTLQDFLANPEAQQAAFGLHRQMMDREIGALNLQRFEGQTIGGVPITRSGLYGMIHLAGAEGTRVALESGGRQNPSDANGTSALDYARRFGGVAPTGDGSIDLTQSRQGLLALGMVKKEMAKDITARITDLSGALARTEFPPMEDVQAVGSLVAALGTPEQKRRVAEIAAAAQYGKAFSQMGPEQRAAAITTWETQLNAGASQFDRHLGETLRKADNAITTAYNKDPYGAAYRFGQGYEALPAINWGAANLSQQISDRVTQQNRIRADQNKDAFSVLRPTEAQSLASTLTTGNAATGRTVLASLNSLPPDIYQATVSDGPIKGALDGMVRSYDPTRLDTSMATLDRVWRQDPQGFKSEFGEETLKRLQTWQAHRDSLTPQAMAEMFQRADDPTMAAARKKLGEEADDKLKPVKAADVATALGSSFGLTPGPIARAIGSDPSPPADAMQGAVLAEEYRRLFKERYVDTGDADKAQQQTIERLKLVWGPSVLTGGALMKNPPERFYPQVNGSHDWMRADVEKALEQQLGRPRFGTELVAGSDASYAPVMYPNWSYAIMSDVQTAAEVAQKRPPSYVVIVTDHATGKIDPPLGADGKPMRFRFDAGPAQEAARAAFGPARDRALMMQDMQANPPLGLP